MYFSTHIFMKILILDSIRSMQNVGALFRTCDGAGFEKIYLTGCTPTPPRNDIAKTALWAENTVDWEYFADIDTCIQDIKKIFRVYSVELSPDAVAYNTLFQQTPENIALVLWNEVAWVKPSVLAVSDEIVMIPMVWKKESLNVSVAWGIVMYATL